MTQLHSLIILGMLLVDMNLAVKSVLADAIEYLQVKSAMILHRSPQSPRENLYKKPRALYQQAGAADGTMLMEQ